MWKIIFGAGALTSVFLYFFGGILQAVFFIPIISGYLVPLGIGKYFAFAVAIPLFFWLNSAMGKLFSLRKYNRTMGLSMILGSICIFSLIQGMQTKDDRFDRWDGSPNHSYVMNGLEVKLFPKDVKFDPASGQATSLLTYTALQEIEWEKQRIARIAKAEQEKLVELKKRIEAKFVAKFVEMYGRKDKDVAIARAEWEIECMHYYDKK